MSQENVETVRAAIDALNRGDMGAALAGAAPGFEFDFSRAVGPTQHGVYGLDQMQHFWDELSELWDSLRIAADEFIEVGEHVVTPLTNHFWGRGGIEVQARPALVWTIRDGAIVRVSMYQEREDALEAVGLAEQDAHADS
jgi:ketosteroid isomerase-like protein